jgi:predicted dehydrogenase
MSERIRVAVVGCGTIARRAHVPAWLANPSVEVVGLCDPAPEAASVIVSRTGLTCPVFASLDDLLDRARPDVVDICSPTMLHVEQTTKALEAGCHVLVEKPPAPSPEDAQRLADLARHRDRKLGAVLNYRYRDLVMSLKEAQDSGRLGSIVKLRITHHGPLVFTDARWLWDESRSKYLLWEFGIHFVDMLVHLLGPHERLLYVAPHADPELGHTTDLELAAEFAGGAQGRLEITADSTRHSSSFTHVEAYGTAGDAFVRWFPPSFRIVGSQVNPIQLIVDEIRSTAGMAWMLARGEYLRYRNISHYRSIDAYVDWILGRAVYPMSFESVIPTLRLLADVEKRIPSYAREAGARVP